MNPTSNLIYGYGDGSYNPGAKSRTARFTCTYGKALRPPLDFKQECLLAAKLIAAQTERPIAICLSGGLDSEVVLRSFLEAGIQISVWTVSLGEHSEHEVKFVEGVCSRLGVMPNYFQLSKAWLDSQAAEDMFLVSNCYHVDMLPQMALLQHLNDLGYYSVLGNGEVLLEHIAGQWLYTELEYDLAWYRFCKAKSIHAACGFFQQTAELQLAALLDANIVDVVSGKNKLANAILKSTRPVKYSMYKSHWPDIMIRQKFDGFEKLRSFSARKSCYLHTKQPIVYNDKIYIPYSKMIKDLEFQAPSDHQANC